MFLAGRSMVPTHNSTLGLDVARSASVKHGLASVIFSLEMSRTEIMMRLLSAEGSIQLTRLVVSEEAPGGAPAVDDSSYPPWLEITRTLDLGIPWLVHTRVRRVSPAG